MSNFTLITERCSGPGDMSISQRILITACYAVGIFGNLLALILLHKKRIRPNNPKHRLMLNCLSANDLTAVTGMLILMYIQMYVNALPEEKSDLKTTIDLWLCKARVAWRVFGLGSGCVTVVMAVERYLAITKPFFYQKVRYY